VEAFLSEALWQALVALPQGGVEVPMYLTWATVLNIVPIPALNGPERVRRGQVKSAYSRFRFRPLRSTVMLRKYSAGRPA
jgi:hypothetical protein